jgi:hypothetical protein
VILVNRKVSRIERDFFWKILKREEVKNMKKIFSSLAIGAALLILGATPTFASAPNWDVSGSWVFDYHYGASVNLHDMTLSQDGVGNLTGSGGAFSGTSPYLYPWTITSGNVSGNDISFTANYTATVVCSFTATGTIATDGTMGGTWTDNCDGNRNGTWTTTSGIANAIGVPKTYNFSFDTYDNGMPQELWATDHFKSVVTITPTGGSCFHVVRVDGGTFDGIAGAKSPGGNGSTTIGPGTTGTITGGLTMDICGTLINNPDTSYEDLRGYVNTTGFYAGKYFHRFFSAVTSETWDAWEWRFNTCKNGFWLDNEATETLYGSVGPNSTMGDINGIYILCRPTTKDQCKKDGWKVFKVFKNQGDCVSFVATEGKNLPAGQ